MNFYLNKNIWSSVLGILLIGLAIYFSQPVFQKVYFQETPATFFVISCLFVLKLFFLSSWVLKKLLERQNVQFGWLMTFQLPHAMNLWGLLIPIQGSFVYFSALMKARYQLGYLKISANYLWLFALELTLDGLIGLGFVFSFHFNGLLAFIFAAMALNLFFWPVLRLFFLRLHKKFPLGFVGKIIHNINTLISEIYSFSLKDYLRFGVLSLITTAFSVLWAWVVCKQFNLTIGIDGVVLATVLMRIGLLIKFTPGNLGTMQLATGGIFALLGYSAADGIFLSVWQYATVLMVSIPIGIWGTLSNRRYFSWKSLFSSTRP